MPYEKHIWKKGDRITAEKLNNIEEGITTNANPNNEKYIVNFNKVTKAQILLSWVIPENGFYLDDNPLKYVGENLDNLYCNGKPLTQKSSEESTIYHYNCIFEPGNFYPENPNEPAFIVAFMVNDENDSTPGYHLWYTNTYTNMVGQTFTLTKGQPISSDVTANKRVADIIQAYNDGKRIYGKLNGSYDYYTYDEGDFQVLGIYPANNPNTIYLEALFPEKNNYEPVLVSLTGYGFQNSDTWYLKAQKLETKNTVFHYFVKKVSDTLVVDEDELNADNNFNAILHNDNHGYQRLASIQCNFDTNDSTQLFYPISQLIPAIGNEKAKFKASGLFYDRPNDEWKIAVLTIINEPISSGSDKSQCTFELINL